MRKPVIRMSSCKTVPPGVKSICKELVPRTNVRGPAGISPPPAAVIIGAGEVQNCQPDGGLSTMRSAPAEKSLLSVSEIVMVPNVVQAGVLPFNAVCAQTVVSLAGVTTTWAKPE